MGGTSVREYAPSIPAMRLRFAVLNAEAGIVAPGGLRLGFANNGENTGGAVYIVPSDGYGSQIIYSEASTDEDACPALGWARQRSG